MVEIDNKKMWESILKADKPQIRLDEKFTFISQNVIEDALKDQGLKWNGKEIVSIEPEPIMLKKGHWYVCIKDLPQNNCSIHKDFIKGNVYYSNELGYLDNYVMGTCDYSKYFRLATEEEILKAKYGITGIGSKKAEGKLGEMISQRMESAKAKEALLPDGELTEFEKAVQQTISSYQFLPQDIDHCVRREDAFNFYKKAASSLLSIARKQIADDIDVDAMVDDYDTSYMKSSALSEIAHEHYRQGIEETLNKIK